MKKTLTILFIILLLIAGGFLYNKYLSTDDIISTIETSETLTNSFLIQGKWTSIDDQNSTIEFKDKIKTDFYAGEKMTQGTFEFKDNEQYLTVTVDNEVFEYSIVELSDSVLTLTYLPRGNTLKYQR